MSSQAFLKIIQSTALLLKNYAMDVPIGEQLKLKGLIQQLRALKYQTLGLQKAQQQKTGIGIKNIFEKGGLRITLYYMPEGEVMQLHNHPSMLVITYLLKGALEADIYSSTDHNMSFEHENNKLTQGEIAFIDGMRTSEKNLHQLKAIQNTFFIDILFPDYDEAKQCTFFQVDGQIQDKKYSLKEVEAKQVDFFEL